jgi:hypothetical protein
MHLNEGQTMNHARGVGKLHVNFTRYDAASLRAPLGLNDSDLSSNKSLLSSMSECPKAVH